MILYVILLSLWISTISADPQSSGSNLYLLDTIVVVLFGEEDTEIILKSDIERPGLGGEIRNLDEIVLELIVYLDAKKHRILPDDAAVDEYLATIQRENNLTSEQLAQVFASAGYTLQEGRALLKRVQAVNTMIDFKIRSNLMVPRKDIECYFEQHPVYEEACYYISRAEIPVTGDAKKQRAKLERGIAKKMSFSSYEWSNPFWIKDSHLAEDKRIITTLEPEQLIITGETSTYFEVFKLIEKKERRLLTIDERYQDISRILQKPRYEELMQRYKESLFNDITIVHM